jgi:hypothetical protein
MISTKHLQEANLKILPLEILSLWRGEGGGGGAGRRNDPNNVCTCE